MSPQSCVCLQNDSITSGSAPSYQQQTKCCFLSEDAHYLIKAEGGNGRHQLQAPSKPDQERWRTAKKKKTRLGTPNGSQTTWPGKKNKKVVRRFYARCRDEAGGGYRVD